jgi:hypothetical protein
MIRILLQELRFVMRGLAAQRRFTAIALLVIALGIGATTAVFSVFNAVILRPLPYAAPDRLVAVTGLYHSAARTTTSPFVPLTEVAKWRPLARSFESMGAFAYTQLPVRIGDRSFSPITALMDPEFLPTLGTPLARGTCLRRTPGRGQICPLSSVTRCGSKPSRATLQPSGAPSHSTERRSSCAEFLLPRSSFPGPTRHTRPSPWICSYRPRHIRAFPRRSGNGSGLRDSSRTSPSNRRKPSCSRWHLQSPPRRRRGAGHGRSG